MRKDELLKLADLLETDAAKADGIKFDLNYWAKPNKEGGPLTMDCGTAACALGLAALSGKFPGLTIDIDFQVPTFEQDGRTYSGTYAAVAYFQISEREADLLFLPDFYKFKQSKKAELEVAARIRNLVATGVVSVVPFDS